MRALLSTNHLFTWSGSELIIVELCEYLRRRGWEVVVHANHWGPRLRAPVTETGATVIETANHVRIFDFDFAWFQHHTAALFDCSFGRSSKAETRIVFAHLSPFTTLEYPGFVIEATIADLVVSNSLETQAGITDARLASTPRCIFPNPPPQAFFDHAKACWEPSLRRLCVVSNHVSGEIRASLDLLRNRHGVECVVYGLEGGLHQRITPKILVGFDAVVTIGKTVPYALASRTPVYCYDQFGGPGYINADNMLDASRSHFSGRCGGKRRDAETIAHEIVTGYPEACTFSAGVRADEYRLEPHLDTILATGARSNADKARKLGLIAHDLERERRMALTVAEGFCNAFRTQHELDAVRVQLDERTRELDHLRNDRARMVAEVKARAAELSLRISDIADRPERIRGRIRAALTGPGGWLRRLVRRGT